jgi:hypothetical protein
VDRDRHRFISRTRRVARSLHVGASDQPAEHSATANRPDCGHRTASPWRKTGVQMGRGVGADVYPSAASSAVRRDQALRSSPLPRWRFAMFR